MSTYLDLMTAAYLDCAKWAEEPDAIEGSTATLRWRESTFTKAAEKRARLDCAKFFAMAKTADILRCLEDESNADPAQVGHDLWLSRNGHGTGFFDDYGPRAHYFPENCNKLQGLARAMGSCYIFESRKRLHLEGGR